MAEKKTNGTSLTGVYESNISEAKSNPKLAIVRTELPADIAKDAKFPTGFIAVPKFDVHTPKDSKFSSVELHDAGKAMNIQYTDKAGERQTAQVTAGDLVEVHAEAKKQYRAQKAAEASVGKETPVAEAQAEM